MRMDTKEHTMASACSGVAEGVCRNEGHGGPLHTAWGPGHGAGRGDRARAMGRGRVAQNARLHQLLHLALIQVHLQTQSFVSLVVLNMKCHYGALP